MHSPIDTPIDTPIRVAVAERTCKRLAADIEAITDPELIQLRRVSSQLSELRVSLRLLLKESLDRIAKPINQ